MSCSTRIGEVVFGSLDIWKEYGGKGRGRTAGTVRKCSATFDQPLRKPSDSPSVGVMKSTGGCGGAVASASRVEKVKAGNGGEKEKAPIRQPSNGSASSGAGSASDNSEKDVSADASLDFPSNRLGRLCENLGKARGPDTCTFFVGVCCGSMRDLINVLIEYKEAVPNQKVCLVFLCL